MATLNNYICTICMRGGSKGVPNKNLRNINGKPLMAYTIEAAIKSNLFNNIVVSTDSKKIANTAKNLGVEAWFLRPSELATDQAPKVPVIRHALIEAEKYYNTSFDAIIDLDATSPLRTSRDIVNAVKQFKDEAADILISGNKARKNPYFNMVERADGKLQKVKNIKKNIIRRQDAPEVYDMNASIYIWKREALLQSDDLFSQKTSIYIMPYERSIDIDTDFEWKIVELFLARKK